MLSETDSKAQVSLKKQPIIDTIQTPDTVVPIKAPLVEPANDDPFTEDTNAQERFPTAFEKALSSTGDAGNMSKVKSMHERNPHLVVSNDARLSQQPSHESAPQASILPEMPSPPRTALESISGSQVTTISESSKPLSGISIGQTVHPQSLKSIPTSSAAFSKEPFKMATQTFSAAAQEQVPPEAFSFNNYTSIAAKGKPSSSSVKSAPIDLTAFKTTFVSRESSSQPFKFSFGSDHLPTSATKVSLAESKTDTKKQVSTLQTRSILPKLSLQMSEQDPNSYLNADTSYLKTTLSKMAIPNGTSATSSIDSIQIHRTSSALDGGVSRPRGGSPSQPLESPKHPPHVSTNRTYCAPSLGVSGEGPSPPTSVASKPIALPGLSTQKPLPSFKMDFIPESTKHHRRSGGSSFARAKSPVRPMSMRDGSRLTFGSEYRVPPRSFDFDSWSKLSSAARFSSMTSFLSRLEAKSSSTSTAEIVDEVAGAPKHEHLWSETEEAGVKVYHGSSAGKCLTASDEEPAIQTAQSKTGSYIPKTPIKSSSLDHDTELLSPELTPEPSRLQHDGQGDLDAVKVTSHPLETLQADIDFLSAVTENAYRHAIITDQLRYDVHFTPEQPHSLATPPASPETSPSHVQGNFFKRNELQGRPSASIQRKPLPTSQVLSFIGQESKISASHEESTTIVQNEFQHKQQGQLEWEYKASRLRGMRGTRLRKSGARLVKGVKTKLIDGLDSIITRLEHEGGDQSSA